MNNRNAAPSDAQIPVPEEFPIPSEGSPWKGRWMPDLRTLRPVRPSRSEGGAIPTALRVARDTAIDGDAAPNPSGAGRFAAPQLMPQPNPSPDRHSGVVRGMMDRLTGVGRIPYARGGAIDDTGMNIPETPESLRAQQRALIEGRRAAQMFPTGTEELALPPGFGRVVTRRGVFHFDPSRIDEASIIDASAAGRENEILGLGPLSKDDVSEIAKRTGESPIAIVERDHAGNEVRGSLATSSTVPMQADGMLRNAGPGSSVDVEPMGDTMGMRMNADIYTDNIARRARADGGQVKTAELHQWDPPWYDKAAYWLGDTTDSVRGLLGYGPMSTGQRQDFNNTFHTTPKLDNLEGIDKHGRAGVEAYNDGRYLAAAGHGAMVGLNAVDFAMPFAVAQGMSKAAPSVRQIARDHRAWEANTPSARGDAYRADAAKREADRASSGSGQAADMARARDLDLDLRRELPDPPPGWKAPRNPEREARELADVERARRLASHPDDRTDMQDLAARMRRGQEADYADMARAGGIIDDAGMFRRGLDHVRNPHIPYAIRDFDPSGSTLGRIAAGGVGAGASAPVADIIDASATRARNALDAREAEIENDAFRGLNMTNAASTWPGHYDYARIKYAPVSMEDERVHRASGGGIGSTPPIEGALYGASGGRADKIYGNARSGSYVIPADVVAHLGQGNSNKGLGLLEKLFTTGPYGMKIRSRHADGGDIHADGVPTVPVALSDGEFVVPDYKVREIGSGDGNLGHDILDAFVLDQRKRNISELKARPGPAKD